MPWRPLAFVAMPFGTKTDPPTNTEIDFDSIYNDVIKPAACQAQVDVLRADEEKLGGFIHAPMYERLLLSEIAIVDLTMANPNVLYELGIRHAARPRSTVLMYCRGAHLPFDVHPLRAIPYTLHVGRLSTDEAKRLTDVLVERLNAAKYDRETVDSPLFRLLPNLPGIDLPHEVTESFRDRARRINSIRDSIDTAKQRGHQAASALLELEAQLRPFEGAPLELMLDLMLAYRDVSAWDHMVNLIEALPHGLRLHQTVQEQLAFALNRRNADGDRQGALRILRSVISTYGQNPETCGLLGRVYKDLYFAQRPGPPTPATQGFLDEAIRWYRLGFDADPRDYYPGINAVTLMLERWAEDDRRAIADLLPVIAFAVARRGGLQSDDYWDIATVMEVAVHRTDHDLVLRAAQRIAVVKKFGWMLETTQRNIAVIDAAQRRHGLDASVATRATQLLGDLRIGV